MRVLLAFDKFKDSLSAAEACRIACQAIAESHPDWTSERAPLADGGDGFRDILTESCEGELHSVVVDGPRGDPVSGGIGLVNVGRIPRTASALLRGVWKGNSTRVAIIEMATVSGLAMLREEERDPMLTSTVGCGQLMRAAAAIEGVGAILLGIGGSATNDLGLGCLAALGLCFDDAAGQTVYPPIPANWRRIANVQGSLPPSMPGIAIACDVANPLLGPTGAASTYGPQKGLRLEDLPIVERESHRLASLLCEYFGRDFRTSIEKPGAGAAGGIGFGLSVALGASFVPGAALVASWLDLDRKIELADLVITGEGRFDLTSLEGKGPAYVLERARACGKPTLVFAGKIHPAAIARLSELNAGGADCGLVQITPEGMPIEEALRAAPDLLRQKIKEVVGV